MVDQSHEKRTCIKFIINWNSIPPSTSRYVIPTSQRPYPNLNTSHVMVKLHIITPLY